MDSFQFYKSLYDRELNRRKDLDSSINLPITILTILVGANSYLLEKTKCIQCSFFKLSDNVLNVVIFILFTIAVFFLVRSYNNLFKGFGYRNIGYSKEIRDFEIFGIPKYNSQVDESSKINFEIELIKKLTEIIDDHIQFNDRRSLDIYRAKTFIIILLVATVLRFLLLTIYTLSK